MSRKWLVLVAGLILISPFQARAQDQAFGDGLQAYYAQDYMQAYSLLNKLIESGAQDSQQALYYYYRGLCYLHLDRQEAAQADFQKGAELEARDTDNRYRVAHLLERVQGSDRVILEQYRTTARTAALQRAEALRRQRYVKTRAAQSDVLQPAEPAASAGTGGFRIGPLAQPPAEEKASASVKTDAATDADPFAAPVNEPAPAKKPIAKKAAEAKPATADNPFSGDTAVEKPAAKPATVAQPAKDDPFQEKAPAAKKPVEPVAKPAAMSAVEAAKKAVEAAGADNPFGSTTEKPAATGK